MLLSSDVLAPAEFLRAWHGNLSGWMTIWCKKGAQKSTAAFNGADYAEQAAQHALKMDSQGYDVYFGLCPLGFKPAGKSRGGAENTCALPGFWVEIDYGSTGHASDSLCPDLTAALTLVAQYPRKPTMVVHSGGGVHAYWRFTEPLALKDAAGREQARAMTDRFQGFFRRPKVNPHGYKIDSTADLARVLRVPGTNNYKELQK